MEETWCPLKEKWKTRTLMDHLEKWWGAGTFSASSVFIFSQPLSVQDFIIIIIILLLFYYLLFYYFGGGGWGLELEGEYSTVAILILTLTTIWMPGTGSKFNQIIFNFHSCFPFLPKLYSGEHDQISDTSKCYFQNWGCIAFLVLCLGKYQFFLFITLVIKFIFGM